MNIIHLVQSVGVAYGGTGFAAQQLSEYLADTDCAGLNVFLCVLESSDSVWPVKPDSRLVWKSLPELHKYKRINFLLHLIEHDVNADLIHLHGIWSPLFACICIWAKIKGITCVVSPHGSLHPWALSHKLLKKKSAWYLYQKFVLQNVNAVWATSDEEVQYIRALGVKTPVVMIPNGIQIPSDAVLAHVHGLATKSRPRQFLFMSRIHPVKGLEMLVQAWATVRQAGWQICIAGQSDNGYQAVIEDQLRQLGLEDDFVWLGMLQGSDKLQALSCADVFVLPTHSENFGLVIAEALACGTPVITTKAAPWPDLVVEKCGWWCETSPEALGQAMQAAMAMSADALHEMGQRGRHMVAAKYGWPKLTAMAKSAYFWLHAQAKAALSPNQKPACVHISFNCETMAVKLEKK